jgi:SAM-dependent methyltransferase
MVGAAQPYLDRQAAFWDARAADYVDPRAPLHRARQAERMERLPRDAQPRPGLRVLDVGAGTGSFSLHAAEQGADVAALDVSGRMLERLREAVQPHAIATVQTDWRVFDPVAAGFERAFDIVCAQMVPSFREVSDFARLERCSRWWCVFIGWGRARRDPWLEVAFAAHHVPWEVPAGVPLAAQLLRELGRDAEPVYWSETWNRTRSIAAAIADATDHLFVRGVNADSGLLHNELSRITAGDALVDESVVEIGLLAWRIDAPSPRDRTKS